MNHSHPPIADFTSTASENLFQVLRNTGTSNIWETDLSGALEKYAQLVNSQNLVDFVEAGFLVEGCSKLYCKKVMLLYNLVVEIARREIGMVHEEEEVLPSATCDSLKKKQKSQQQLTSWGGKFESLDKLTAVPAHALNCNEDRMTLSRHKRVFPDAPLLSRSDLRKRQFTLVDYRGDECANMNDFAMNYCVLQQSGAFLIPTVTSGDFPTEQDEEPSFLCTDIEEANEYLDPLECEIDARREDSHELPTEIVFQVDAAEESLSTSDRDSLSESLLQETLSDENDYDQDVNRFLQTKFYKRKVLRGSDTLKPLNSVFLGLVDEIEVKRQRENKKSKALWRNGREDVTLLSSVESRQWVLQLPDFTNPEFSTTDLLLQERANENENSEVSRYSDLTQGGNDICEFENYDFNFEYHSAEREEIPNEQIATNMSSDAPFFQPLEGEEQPMTVRVEAVRDAIEYNPREESEENLEQSLEEQVDAYFQEAAQFAPTNSLSQKMKKWEDYVQTILKEMETREPFDIKAYSEQLMDLLDKEDQVIPFEDVCKRKPHWKICRYFLTSLQMANERNIEITTSVANCNCPIGLIPLRKKRSKRPTEHGENSTFLIKRGRQNSDGLKDFGAFVDIDSDETCEMTCSDESSFGGENDDELSSDSDVDFYLSDASRAHFT